MPADPPPPEVLATRQRVGRRVRALREGRGWSQERLGERAGVDRKTIYRVELATHSTHLDALVQIAMALGVSPAALFT